MPEPSPSPDGLARGWLRPCGKPLVEAYDTALLDLDGVVYVGPDAVPGAVQHLTGAAERGMRLAYVTNNASRPPDAVAEHLRALGLVLDDEDVVTSAQAAARLLAEDLPAGSPVFVIGGRGLVEALEELGLRPVQEVVDEPAAVVSGYHPDLRWGTVLEGAILVRRGLPWVASNTDLTVPTPHGPGPGNGVLVRAVADFAERQPRVAGKPQPPLFRETVRRVGAERPLVVGDRLDTDIDGARRAGMDSLLVLTGVTRLPELVSAPPEERPTYLGADLGALLADAGAPEPDGREHGSERGGAPGRWVEGGWVAAVVDGRLEISGTGEADAWWRVVAAAAWEHLDAGHRPVDVSELVPPR